MLIAAVTVALVANLAPPPRYDHEPRVPYHVSYVSEAKLHNICVGQATGAKDMVLGCSLSELGLIYVAKGMRPEVADIILRHEKAHINGWKHRGSPFDRKVASK